MERQTYEQLDRIEQLLVVIAGHLGLLEEPPKEETKKKKGTL